MYVSSVYIIAIPKKRQIQQNKIKSTRELTVRQSSFSVFVNDFEQVFSDRSENSD